MRRLALLVFVLLCAALPARAQIAIAPHDSALTAQLRPRVAEVTLAMSGGVVLFANSVARWDVDAGGYRDRWLTQDKLLHYAVAYGLTDGCAALGGRRWVCAPIVAVLGYGWELSQAQSVGTGHGFVSSRDAWAVAAGALTNALLHSLTHR